MIINQISVQIYIDPETDSETPLKKSKVSPKFNGNSLEFII